MVTRRRARKRKPDQEERPEEQPEEQPERLSSGQRYALFVAVLLILGAGVIFIDTILAWVMRLLGRAP